MISKLETVIEALVTRDDLGRFEMALCRELSAQAWKIISILIGASTALMVATYYFSKNVG